MGTGARFRQKTQEVPTHPAAEAFKDAPRIGSGWVAFAGSTWARRRCST